MTALMGVSGCQLMHSKTVSPGSDTTQLCWATVGYKCQPYKSLPKFWRWAAAVGGVSPAIIAILIHSYGLGTFLDFWGGAPIIATATLVFVAFVIFICCAGSALVERKHFGSYVEASVAYSGGLTTIIFGSLQI